MTLLIWLAVSSLAWGAVLWGAGRMLQRSNNVSGRARQWVWRGATALLVAPWLAAPFVVLFGLGLAPAETMALATVSPAATGDTLAAMHLLELENVETSVVENGGTLMSWLAGANPFELALLVVIAGWLVRFVLAQHALKSLLGIVNMSHPARPGAAKTFVASWTRRLKLRGEPRLLVTQEKHSPFSFGIVRPTICLPEGLEDRLSKESLDLVVGHECLHVARGDGWLRPLERVTADVLWFNPFAWLIRRELDVARELAVDEAVIALASSRIVYARALRDVAGFSAGLSTAAPAASMSLAGGRSLMLRVSRTLSQASRKPARAAILAACLLGLVGAPIAVAQVMLAVPAPPQAPEAPEAPEAFDAPEALEAPEAPEEPQEAESRVYVSPDGMVRASFAATVSATGTGEKGGYSVLLESTGAGKNGDVCAADLDGLGRLDVSRGQTVASGQAIGTRGNGSQLSFRVECTDGVNPEVAPPAPPAAEFGATDGTIRTTFKGRVVNLSGDAAKGYRVELLQTAPSEKGEICFANLNGLSVISVRRDQVVAKGDAVGQARKNGNMSFSVTCSDELDSKGYPKAGPPPAAPPAPPAPASPVDAIAPPAPVAAPSPIAPRAPMPPARNNLQPPPAPAAPPAPASPPTPIVLEGAPRAIIIAPGRISGPYGARIDPISQEAVFHEGVDIATATGSAVASPISGRVTQAGMLGDNGHTVTVQGDGGVKLVFTHLDEIEVKAGDSLKAGDTIGTVGSSGRSTGAHLHLEISQDGEKQDPEKVGGLVLIGQN